jgi:hypothetical protein
MIKRRAIGIMMRLVLMMKLLKYHHIVDGNYDDKIDQGEVIINTIKTITTINSKEYTHQDNGVDGDCDGEV